MSSFGTLEGHIRHHHEKAKKWAMAGVHLSAVSFVVSLSLLPRIDASLTEVVQTATALFVVAISLFLLATNVLYQQVESRTAATPRVVRGETQEKELEATSLEAMGRLAGGVAHDFNNSLLVLLNCIEMMRNAEETKDRHTLLVDMETVARGAQSTASRLISLSRNGTSDCAPTDPRGTLRSIASTLRRLFPENILVRDYLRGTPAVRLGSGTLEQVVLNICLNSRDAMLSGGELTIRCYEDHLEQRVIVEIEDTATVGRETRTANVCNYQGVTECGGKVVTRVLENRGTSTVLMLPVADRVVVDSSETTDESSVTTGTDVLLVDDNELVLTMLSSRLEEAGYTVWAAQSVEEAVTQLGEREFDALICDGVLPDGTPNQVVDQFKKTSTGPVIVCSGYSRNDPLLAGLSLDAAAFLQKPFSTDELLNKLGATERAA